MIKNVNTDGLYLHSTYPDTARVDFNRNYLCTGQVRFNDSTQCMEVYDGTSWHNVSVESYVTLSPYSASAIEWVHKKMRDEEKLLEKMEKYPALKAAYEQFKTIEALVYEDDND